MSGIEDVYLHEPGETECFSPQSLADEADEAQPPIL